MPFFTHAQRLERWLGAEQVERISGEMCDWYGPPIAIANIPGAVYATRGGDFCGPLRGGYFGNLTDFWTQRVRRILRNCRNKHYAGFASLSDLISEATAGGKIQQVAFSKSGTAGIANRSNSLFNVGSKPPAGGVGGTTGTGRACTRTTTGAFGQANAAGGDTLHLTTLIAGNNVGAQCLLMYDRLWDMNHTMTVDPRSCDAANLPTRYQTTALASGNFISGEVTTVLPAATPTVAFDYVDEAGNNTTGPAFSTIASAAAVNTIPFTAGPWFYPLDPADLGVRSLQNSANAVDLSAAMASGAVNWFIGHPICYVPIAYGAAPIVLDGINSAFNLERIYNDACLTFIGLLNGAASTFNFTGSVRTVSG